MDTIVDTEDMDTIDPTMVEVGADSPRDALPLEVAEVVFPQVLPHPEHERPLVLEVLEEDNYQFISYCQDKYNSYLITKNKTERKIWFISFFSGNPG